MKSVRDLQNVFKRVEMLQKTFSLIREGRVKASDFRERVALLTESVKVDVVTPAIDEAEQWSNHSSKLERYLNELNPYTEQTEYYNPMNISKELPQPQKVRDALAAACGLNEEEAQNLFADYIFVIDQRNEMADQLNSMLVQLKQDKESERQERLQEDAEQVEAFAGVINKQKDEIKPTEEDAVNPTSNMRMQNYCESPTDDQRNESIRRLKEYATKEIVDELLADIEKITTGRLASKYYPHFYKNGMDKKTFFRHCERIAHRNGEKGWTYESFKKK